MILRISQKLIKMSKKIENIYFLDFGLILNPFMS